jgi:membrane protease YdiL (CAAX protease family)
VSLLAGVGEEILIRGGLQSILVGLTSPFVGMLLASLIFGVMHFLSKIYVLITFVIGFVFALVFYLTDSMLLVMVAHTVYDIFAFAMIVKFPHMLGLELKNEQISIIDEADC